MNSTHDLKNFNNSKLLIDTSFTGSKDGKKEKKGEEDVIQSFLTDTEEINDIIISNGKGEVTYFNSRYNTLDEEYLRLFKDDFKTVYNYFYSNMFSPEEGKDNLNEYLYQKGLKIMKRKYKFTRICLPFLFARDLKHHEELTFIKLVNVIENKNYLVFVTYFPNYTSALIISHLKTFLSLYNKNLKFDDDFNRYE